MTDYTALAPDPRLESLSDDPEVDPVDLLLISSGLRRDEPLPFGELGNVLRRFATGLPTDRVLREVALARAVRELRDRYAIAEPDGRRLLITAEAEVNGAASSSRWRWFTAADLAALPPPEELVRNVLPAGGFAVLYGPRGIGKTFLALDLACDVDSGGAWHGHVVRRGRVAYVLAEGRGGLARRISAWQSDHGGEDPGVRFLTHAVRLLDIGDVDRLIESLASDDEPAALLVIDTLARCLAPGDENSTRDMGVAVAALDRIREATGATVLVLHHTGHDQTRERGSTALGAAADTLLSVARNAGVLTLTCEKQRDAIEFPPLRFRLHPVAESVVPQLVVGDDGITGADAQALEALEAIAVEEGVPMSVWDLSAELGHGQLYRSRKKLLDMGLVRAEKDGRYVRYWPVVVENGDGERSHESP